MPLELQLCGPFRLTREGEPVTVPYLRARALLAFLALEPGSHPRERLADLFWPDQPPTAARASLRRMLSLLRTLLGPYQGALEADRQGVRLRLPEGCRVDALELLAPPGRCPAACDPTYRALCLAAGERLAGRCRGPLLEGLTLPESPELEFWLETRRAGLRRRALALAERLSRCLEQAGDPGGALRHARRAVALEPLDEAGHRRVMALLAADGQAGAALLQYDALRQLLAAELGVEPGAATEALAERCRAAADRPAAPPANLADRRPLTVLCLRVPADPQESDGGAERVQAGLARAAWAVAAAGGTAGPGVAGTLFAYFGYPQRQEEATRLAVECALTLAGDGMAAGLDRAVVVSDPGAGLADVAGHLTRAAMTLAHRAGSGEVVAGPAVAEAVRGWFRITPLPAEGVRIEGPTGALSRLEARPSGVPLLGRAAEQARLAALWAEAQAGAGRALLVRGEPGIGKSRLVAALAAKVDRLHEARCRPEWAHTPFQPLTRLLAEAWGLPPAAECDLCRTRLAHRFPAWGPQRIARLCELLGAGAGPLPPPSPEHRRALLAELAAALGELARSGPALLWVEDAHWADPSSLEALALLLEQPPAHLLTVVTARPEFRPPWGVAALDLPRLSAAHGADLVARLAAGRLPPGQAERLVAICDGVPLFIEELVRAVLAGHDSALPASLEELLAARLGLVPESLPLAQLAATAGRRFTTALLAAAAPAGDPPAARLEPLLRATLIRPEGAGEYAFSHALVQEAAYRSMTAAVRRANHALIAQALLQNDPAIAEQEPGLLAWHFGEAQLHQAAIGYAIAAARQATARSAHREALHHLESALAHLARLPAGPERDGLELSIRVHQGLPLSARHGYGSQEARAAYARALELAGPEGDTPERFPLLWGLWLGSSSWSDFDTSLDLARRLMKLAPLRPQDPWALGHACYALGNSLFCRGEPAAAAATLAQGAAASPAEGPLSPYGEDPLVTNLGFSGWVLWFLGREEEALAASRRALARAQALGHPYTLGYAHILAGILHRLRGEIPEAGRLAAEAYQLGRLHDLALWEAAGMVLQGWAQAAAGEIAGLALIEKSVELGKAVMGGVETMFLAHLVDAAERCAAWPQALAGAEAGLAASAARGDHHFLPEFLRIRAVAGAALGAAPAETAAQLRQALTIAQRQGAVALARRVQKSEEQLAG